MEFLKQEFKGERAQCGLEESRKAGGFGPHSKNRYHTGRYGRMVFKEEGDGEDKAFETGLSKEFKVNE